MLRAILSEINAPLDKWIVIDDYHELKSGSPAQFLIDSLQESGRFRFLIASRRRPRWAAARLRIYGDLLELDEQDLAFNELEAAELLIGLPQDAARLQDETRGWPVLLALALMATEHERPEASDLRTLYEFLAQEILRDAPEHVQATLLRLATLPPLSRNSLTGLLGEARVIDAVLATGVAYHEDDVIQLHPLARDFLLSVLEGRDDGITMIAESFRITVRRKYWDEAFYLIERFNRCELLDELVTESYLPLVEEGRVSTLAAFGDYGASSGSLSQPLVDLIHAEIDSREGRFKRARSLALEAARQLPKKHPLQARCFLIAGLSAEFEWEHEDAFELYTTALTVAQRPRDTNDASWGRCLSAIFLEDERLRDSLRELAALPHLSAEDRLHLLHGRQVLARLFDGLSEVESDMGVAETLLPHTSDPMVRTGWRNMCGYILVLRGKYAEAAHVLKTALSDVDRYALEFARPHLEWSLAAANLGQRRFARADSLLRRVEHHVAAGHSFHLHLNARALRARLLLCQRRTAEAVTTVSLEFPDAPKDSMYGEYLATRALALALDGQSKHAIRIADEADATTTAVETQLMTAATRAITAIGTSQSTRAVESLVATATTLGTWDGLVCAMRASPELLREISKVGPPAVIEQVLKRSNDSALAHAVGLTRRRPDGRRGLLSRRETEVIDLLTQGLKTRAIATALYISDSTVKVHVRNIFRKLDAHTRAEAVARYTDTSRGAGDSN